MLHQVLLTALLAPLGFASQQPDSQLDSMAARIEASDSVHEKLELARLGRRLDKGGSLWWFEVEIRIRLSAGDNCEVIRLCNLALENPLIDSDRAVVYWLRAVAFERLEDEERLIADLLQVTKLSPGHAEASAKLHGALAIRIQRRQVARRIVEALQATEENPTDAYAWLELARSQNASEESRDSVGSYRKVRDLDESAMTLSDWATLTRTYIWGSDYDGAEICLEKAKALGTDLPDLAKLLERERKSSEEFSGGMGDYPYVDEYAEEEGGEPVPPADPPQTLTAEEWQQTLDRWTGEMAKVREAHGPLSETFYPLQEQAFEWANRLDAVEDRAGLEAILPSLQEHLSAHTEWRKSQDQNEARYNRLSEEINLWFEWASELERAGHPHESIGPTKEITESLWELENPARVCQSEDLADQLEATRLQFDRLDAFTKGLAELIQEHSGLANEEALSKSSELMSMGEPTPELLAILGLAHYRLGQIEQALVPLHQSLAFPSGHGLEAEVRDSLAQLQQRGQALIPTAIMLRESGNMPAAIALAGRAADLACLDAQSHMEEARCLEISTIRLHALRCARLASNLKPDSRPLGVAHVQIALRDRELSEAMEVADRLVAQYPRDTELLYLRAPILAMCGDREKAEQDLFFLNVLRNKSGRPSLGRAFNERLQRTGFTLYRMNKDTSTWADKQPYDFAAKLFWFPGGDPKSEDAKAYTASLHSIMAGRAGIETLKEEPKGLTALQKRQWPAVVFYLKGEIMHAQGDREKARKQFEKALAHDDLPMEMAHMIHVRTKLPMGLRSFQRHHPLRVPQLYKDAQYAIKIAKPGQTVLLSERSHSINMDLKRSIRIQGVGPTETRVYYSFSSNDSSNVWSPLPSKKSTSSISHGWVELAHLGLEVQTYTDDLEPGDAAQFAHHLEAGGLLVEDCRFRGKTRFQIHPGTRALFLDCDFDQEIDSFLFAKQAHVTLDRCVARSGMELSNGSQLSASRITLTRAGHVQASGPGTTASIGEVNVIRANQSAFRSNDQAQLTVTNAFWESDAAALVLAADQGTVQFTGLEILGEGTVPSDGVTVADLTQRKHTPDARKETPVVVATKDQLMNAFAEGKRHIELKPGEYELQGYEVAGQLILKAQEPGVVLHSRTDREDHIFKVLEKGRLDLHGIELDVKNGRKPQKGEQLYGTAASIMLDKKYDEYSLVRVYGTARLIDCNQGPQSRKGVWVGEVGSNGLMTSTGLADGVAFRGRDGGRAILMDSGVRDIEVLDGASVALAGTGQLKSLKVSGSESIIQLNDLRQSRINHVAFHNGAQDPRSDLQRRADGRDPADVQRELIGGSRRKWIDSMRSSMSAEEKARNLLEHAKAYEKALAYSVNRMDERFKLAGSEVAPHMMKDRAIQREYLRLCHQEFYDGSRLFDAVIYQLSENDRNAFYAENRAVAALGKQADATELRIFASWEEAILAGDATRQEMESGREMGLSPQGYKQAIARASRQDELREAEAHQAIASGDKARIKRALQAISLDRWFQHVIDSEATTSGDIVEALAASPSYKHRNALLKRQSQFQAAAGHGGYSGHYGSYRGGSSSYTAPNNDFARWQVQRNTWNRDMDRALDAVKSSSYRNFRNNYDF